MKMKMLALLIAVPLAGCAADYGYYGPPGADPIAYDGFYDDYYGPIADGYWGDGGIFYYRRYPHGRFHPDRRGHFRHDMGPGHFHSFHGSMTPPAHVGGGHHR